MEFNVWGVVYDDDYDPWEDNTADEASPFKLIFKSAPADKPEGAAEEFGEDACLIIDG